MTTFTTEDRISSTEYFANQPWPAWPWITAKDYRQGELELFFPLTEQIPLDLDYGPTHIYYRAKGIAGSHGVAIQGSIYEYSNVSWTTAVTNIAPQLTVQAIDSVGQLNIGGISVGLENKPKWYQRVLYKLLGFTWKQR